MKELPKSVFAIIFGTVLNLIWEISHAGLYSYAYGGDITFNKLLISALGDAAYVGIVILFVCPIILKNKKRFLLMPIGITSAILVEMVMLRLGMWGYNDQMPLIPLLKVGISPAIQLGVTTYLATLVQDLMPTKISQAVTIK